MRLIRMGTISGVIVLPRAYKQILQINDKLKDCYTNEIDLSEDEEKEDYGDPWYDEEDKHEDSEQEQHLQQHCERPCFRFFSQKGCKSSNSTCKFCHAEEHRTTVKGKSRRKKEKKRR